MSDFINTIDLLGDDVVLSGLLGKSITEFNDDVLTDLGTYAFFGCTELTSVDLPNVTSVGAGAFYGCSKLKTLVLRSNTLCSLGNSGAFTNSAIGLGTGYIYVPAALVDSYKLATGWSTYAAQFRALEDYTVDGTTTGALKYTWSSVRTAISDGTYRDIYKVGDIMPFDFGSYGVHNMEIVAFDTDEKADGSGTAAITWLSKEQIANHNMNSAKTNENGWAASEMRTWLQTDVYNALPAEAKSFIVPVKKTYFDYTTASTLTCEDNLWLPSYREVIGGDIYETSGATYASHFLDDASRIKKFGGTAAWWWLRSATNNRADRFCDVNSSGGVYHVDANTSGGVVLGFCT